MMMQKLKIAGMLNLRWPAMLGVFLLALLLMHQTALAQTSVKSPPARYLFVNGQAQGNLYLPMNEVNATMRFAAQELQEHLQAITGGRMQMAYRPIKSNQAGIILAVLPAGEWRENTTPQSFTITQDPRLCRVYIIGNTSLAVLYGVYEYLGTLGVRWFSPGEVGTHLPQTANIAITSGERTSTPSFSSRSMALSSVIENNFSGINSERDFYDYQLYLMRNRTMLDRFAATRGVFNFNIEGTRSGHAIKPMTGLTSTKVKAGLMETSPERFALSTGRDGVQKRRYNDAQVCFTNQTNIDTAIANAVDFFDKLDASKLQRGSDLDYQYTVELGLSDTTGLCECDACEKVAGDGPRRKDRLVWSFWNKVARGLAAQKPGKLMAVYCPYLEMTKPPEDVKIESNVMTVTALVTPWEQSAQDPKVSTFPLHFLDQITSLRNAGATLACYNYTNFPWSPTPLLLLDNAKTYHDLGYKYYHIEAMQRSEYVWPLIWSIAQYTWDASREPRAYLEEYCTSYFGDAGGRRVMSILQEMTDNALSLERLNYGGAADTSYMFPDAFIGKIRSGLRSEIASAQGKERTRLERFAMAIEAQLQLAQVYRAFCVALNTRDAKAIGVFRKKAQTLDAYWSTSNLNELSNRYRTPQEAANLFLSVDFDALKPAARKDMAGVIAGDARWLQELFAGEKSPGKVDNLFPLPEQWLVHVDGDRSGSVEKFTAASYDPTGNWQLLSTWNYISSQGYTHQLAGYFWCRTSFESPVFPKEKRVYLRIGSLDDTGNIYLNGKLVGSQTDPNHWDKSFELDVTEHLKQGQKNELLIHGFDSGGAEGVWRPSALYTR